MKWMEGYMVFSTHKKAKIDNQRPLQRDNVSLLLERMKHETCTQLRTHMPENGIPLYWLEADRDATELALGFF